MPLDHLSLFERIQEYGVLGYLYILFIAFWAGTAKYLSSLRKDEKPTMMGWFIDTTVSGFVGIIAAMVCQYYQLDFLLTASITGIMAHNGTRSLYLISNFLKKNMILPIETKPESKNNKVYSKRSNKKDKE